MKQYYHDALHDNKIQRFCDTSYSDENVLIQIQTFLMRQFN